MNPIAWVAFCGVFAAVLAGSGMVGYRMARADCMERVAEIDRVARAIAAEQAKAAEALAVEIEILRARPARIRTVTTEVIKHVQADADCSSLPPAVRSLWNASGGRDPEPGAAAVDHGRVPALANAGR